MNDAEWLNGRMMGDKSWCRVCRWLRWRQGVAVWDARRQRQEVVWPLACGILAATQELKWIRLKRLIDQVANRCPTVVAPASFGNMKLDASKADKTVIVSVRQLKLPCTKRKMEWFATFLPQPCIFNLAGGSKENKRHMFLVLQSKTCDIKAKLKGNLSKSEKGQQIK